MRTAVVIFPGSTCGRDVESAIADCALGPVDIVRHCEENLHDHSGPDLVVITGGASYGDSLRPGALAATAPIMKAVREHAERGGLVLGIRNGFQILTEARMLPGVLLPNSDLRFICAPCHIRVERNDTPFTKSFRERETIQIPIAHGNGRYFLPPGEHSALEARRGVVFRYSADAPADDAPAGEEYSPDGSLAGIAGVINEKGNVLGLMPCPERATLKNMLRGTDGRILWNSLGEHFGVRRVGYGL